MDNITKEINAESNNQELQIQLIEAQKYKKAFEQLVKEIKWCINVNNSIAWKTLPHLIIHIKKENKIS